MKCLMWQSIKKPKSGWWFIKHCMETMVFGLDRSRCLMKPLCEMAKALSAFNTCKSRLLVRVLIEHT